MHTWYSYDQNCTLGIFELNYPYFFSLSLTLQVLNFWKFTSCCSLKPLWSGMGEVVPARTSPTLHPPSPPTVHQLLRLALEELRSKSRNTDTSSYCQMSFNIHYLTSNSHICTAPVSWDNYSLFRAFLLLFLWLYPDELQYTGCKL